ncbi:MAG: dipeptide epimerase [Methylobacteriaceae bacterium]|nr:dipeptide epimerase [Methylobacteriaceae bacterium]
MRRLEAAAERLRLRHKFVISRGGRDESLVVVATIHDGSHRGRGECVPYPRYGESVDSVLKAIAGARTAIEAGADRSALQSLLPPGAARNAIDCALWDLDAKRLQTSAVALAGLHRLAPATTAYTISLGTPEEMAKATAAAADRPLLKVKLGGEGDPARIAAVRDAAPGAELIVDANEGWRAENFVENHAACSAAGVALIEQPLAAGQDGLLAGVPHPIPICADESVHDREGLDELRPRYDAINVKLDKTGGLTEALAVVDEAERLGFAIVVGCMVASSLAMAPAMLLAPRARFVDLDGPLLLARDRADGLTYTGSIIHPPNSALWG